MFEKILEKVLENYFGRFITGLDKNNLKLGVWSGNVAIENVNLKPEVIELLELPIKLKHSKIGKMHFKIPWKKLSSAPVEILIDNLYITISPLDRSEWTFSDQAIIEKKFQLLMDYCKECMLKNLKKKKKQEGEEDQSFLDKLTTKIIDNLQMKISNIHIRCEQEDIEGSSNIYKMSQSWGITLQSLDVGTTDDQWKKQFIDRTDTTSKFVAMNRLFELKNLAIYWNAHERDFYKPNNQLTYVDYMEQRIFKDDGLQAKEKSEFIITISSEVKVIQNPPKSVFLPLYHSEIQLQWLDLILNRNQFKQLLNLLENFSVYTNLLWVQRKKAQDISEQAVKDYQEIFTDLFQKVYLTDQKSIETLQEKERALLKSILRSVGYENLIQWTKAVAKRMIKENRVTHLTQKKLKKDSSWWKAAKSKDKESAKVVEDLTPQEVQDIEDQIENMFDDQSAIVQDIIRPADSIEKRFEFVLKGGGIQITSTSDSEVKYYHFDQKSNTRIEKEGIKLIFSDMQCIFEQVTDGSIEVIFKLKNLELKLMTQYQGQEMIYTSFLQKSLKNQQNEAQFFKMSFHKHVELIQMQQDKAQPQLTASLGLQIQPVECIYNPTFVKRFNDFFETQHVDEGLKTATWDKIEALQDQTQTKVDYILNSDVKLTLQLDIFSPILILPFNMNNDSKSECWIINLGNLRMSTIQSEAEIYDCYRLELLQMSFHHCPTMDQQDLNQVYNIVSSEAMDFEIHRLKKKSLTQMPVIKIDGQIPPLELNLTTYLHAKLFEIKSLLIPSQSDIEQIEILQNEKHSILKNQLIQGNLKKKDQFVNLWTPYFGVCSGSYIYLFKDHKDIHPEQHVYIKKANVSQVQKNQYQKIESPSQDHVYAFQIASRYDKTIFSCNNQDELNLWLKFLGEQIDSLAPKNKLIQQKKHQAKSSTNELAPAMTYLQISLNVQDIKITLQKNTMTKMDDIYLLQINKFVFTQTISTNQILTKYSINSLCLMDYIYKYNNPDYQTFIKSYDNDTQFLQVKMISDRIDPQGDDWVQENLYEIDNLQFNWKPDVLLQLMKLYQTHISNDIISLQDDEAQLKLQGLSLDEIRQIKLDKLIEEENKKQNLLQQVDHSMSQYLISQEAVLKNLVNNLDLFTLNQVESSMQILSKSTIIINKAVINLLHQQTHTCLGYLDISGFVRTTQQTQIAQFNEGQVSNMTLYDLTNYPHTIDTDLQFQSCKVNKVISKQDCNLPMLVFKQARYDRNSLKHKQTSFLKMEFCPVIFNYVHQPFMRFINYINIQMLTLIATPEYLTMNSNFNIQQKAKLVIGTIEDVFKSLFDPTFVSYEVTLDRPIIALARNYEDEHKIEINSKQISYSNHQSQDPRRLTTSSPQVGIPIWCDTLTILFDQMCLTMYHGKIPKQVSNFSTYQAEWTKMLHFNEISDLFPQAKVSNHFNIKSYQNPMNLDLMHQDFQYLCAVMMHNFTYDDQKDALFIHDYEVYKSIAPNEMRFMTYLPHLSIFMRNDQDVLIANMCLEQVQLEYLMEQNLNKSIKFYSKGLEFSEFVQCQSMLEQIVIIGKLGQKQQFKSTQEVRIQCLEIENDVSLFEALGRTSKQRDFRTNFGERQERKTSLQMQKEKQSFQFMTDIIIERQSTSKELILSFNNVGMSAQTKRLLQVVEWMKLSDECYPIKQPSGLSMMINLNNAFMCFPTRADLDTILTAKGNINYIFDAQPLKPQKTQNSHKITLSNLELFMSPIQDIKGDNKITNKRQIVLPLLLYFGMQENFDRIFLIRKIDCTFDRTCIKVSHQDLSTISSALQYQIEQVDKQEDIAEQLGLEQSSPLDYYMLSSSLVPEQYKTLLSFNCAIYGIQVIFLSGQEIPVPLFDLFLNESQISYTSKAQQYLFNIQSQIQSSHYNNSLGMWEPFIEPFLLQIDYSHNQNGNPQQCTTVLINPDKFKHIPLNINLTAPMILKLRNLLQVWQYSLNEVIESSPLSSIKQSSAQDIDTIQAVSPYILVNKTGHQVEISALTKTFTYIGTTQMNDPIKSILQVDESQSIRFATNQDSMFQESFSNSDRYTIERRKLTIKIKSEIAKFSEVKNLDFDKLYNKKVQLEMNINGQMHKAQMVIDLRQMGDYKQLTISSSIQVNNRSQRSVQIKVISKFDNSRFILAMISSNDIYYIPLGFENAILQFRFQAINDQEWSKYIDLEKVSQQTNDATFDLCPQSLQSLILLVQKPSQQNQFLQLKLQCPLVIYNTLPLTLSFKIVGVDKPYICERFQQIKVAERQPNQEFKVLVKLPGFQMSSPITLVGKQPTGQSFIVRDYLGIELKLNYVYIGQEEGFFTFILEAGMIIQQTIGRPIYFYGRSMTQKERESKKQIALKEGPLHPSMSYLPGQTIPGITEQDDLNLRNVGSLSSANEYELMQVSFCQGGEIQSNREQFQRTNYSLQFPVKEALGRYLVRIPMQNGYMDTVAETTNIIVENRLQVISPMLTINPKCIIVNHFDGDLIMKQNGVMDQEIVIARGQRVPLYWFTYFSKYMQFYYKVNQEVCKSGFIGLEITGTLTCPTRRVSDSAIQDYILVSSIEEQKTQFIKIEAPRAHSKPLYLIQNKLPGLKIQFYQSCYEEININLKTIVQSFEEQSYAFDHPTHPKQLNIEFIGDNNAYVGMLQVSLSANQCHQETLSENYIFYINSFFSIEHKQIVVSFQEKKPQTLRESAVSDMLVGQVEIALPQMTISFMSTPNQQAQVRKETILVSIKGIEIVQISDENIQTTQFKVQDLQIDSNWSASCQFPVLLTQKNREGYEKSLKPIISGVISRAHNVTFVNYFKSMKLAIQPLAIKLTEGTLENIYLFYLDLANNNQKQFLIQSYHAWQRTEVQSSQLCFIEKVEVYPIIFNLSFLMLEATGKEIKRLIKAPTGKSFMSCDEASIKLHGVVAENIQQTPSQFIYRLGSNYQDDFSSNLLKLIGSMEILGNPMGLVRNVGEGFQDLWEMPKEGFIKGPIEGGIGIAKGVGSLTKGVVSGTFNTVQKITGSLAQGFSSITMDDEYQKDRAEVQAVQAKHLVDGLGQGMISLFTGVGQGIAGVFLQPVQGAEKDGIEGFFKGTLKGLAGLVVKPVVGVMDLTSKTAEGIKNTANFFDDKSNEKRYRPPRVFYSSEQYFKNFRMQDSEIVSLLQKINPTSFKKSVELIECVPNQIQNRFFVYVMTMDHFILLDVTNKSIKFDVPSRWIQKIGKPSETVLIVQLSQPIKSFDASKTAGFSYENDKIKLTNDDSKLLTMLCERLCHLMQIINDQ